MLSLIIPLVMAEDEAVKNNRLALLAGLVAKAKAVAAFQPIEHKIST